MTRFTSVCITSALVATAIALTPATSFAGPRDTPIAACAAKAMPATAVIQVQVTKEVNGKEVEGMAVGSGFVIDSRGFILTNQHVVDGATVIKLKLSGDRSWRPASLVFADATADLAVVHVKTDKPLPQVTLGTSSDLAIGEPTIVIGAPLGDAFSLSSGVVSKLHVPVPGEDPPSKYLIQTDAAVNHGNSGGPMFNAECETIGVVELKLENAEGVGFAITADRAARVVASQMNAEWAGVTHGITGVTMKVVAPTGADRLAVFVKSMSVGSPAAAVLKLGDRIVKVSGRPVNNVFDLERSVWDNKAGDTVKVDIVRDGKFMNVSMTLAAAPAPSDVKD